MVPPSGMKLTFADEFNALDLYSTWKPTDQWGNRYLPANGELQTYVDPQYKGLGLNPFSINDGVLNIKASKAGDTASKLGDRPYTSGMLSSFGSGGFSQQYGYFEIRAQLPAGKGMWPAFWLLSDSGKWPPELDIMESIGSIDNYAVQSIHSSDGNQGDTTYTSSNLQAGFHTYGMNWTKDTITYYIDDKKISEYDTPSDMHGKMHMLVNLAVGGTWPGSPDSTTDWSKTNFKIDYVRVYSNDPSAKSVATSAALTEAASSTLTKATSPGSNGAVALSNAMPSSTAGDSFRPDATSKTYSADEMGIDDVTSPTTVTVSYNGDNDVTVTNNGEWSAIRKAAIDSDAIGDATVHNFVDAHITLGDTGGTAKNRTVTVSDVKRGAITTGSGNDKITVTGHSNSNDGINLLTIDAGDGDNTVSYTGEDDNRVRIATGTGDDAISVSGPTAATISGGTGRDVFSFMANAHATITDFKSADDRIALKGIDASDVRVRASGDSTLIDLGSRGRITLSGAAHAASDLHLSYA